MKLRCRTTPNQRSINVVYVSVAIYNVQQRWNKVVYFNVELNNVRQRQNNVFILNVDFHNVGQRRNNIANITIWKKSLDSKIKEYFWASKNMLDHNLLPFFLILTGICKGIFVEPQKFLKHRIYWITKGIFKPSHFVRCQLVFNFKEQAQGLYDYDSFNFICIF